MNILILAVLAHALCTDGIVLNVHVNNSTLQQLHKELINPLLNRDFRSRDIQFRIDIQDQTQHDKPAEEIKPGSSQTMQQLPGPPMANSTDQAQSSINVPKPDVAVLMPLPERPDQNTSRQIIDREIEFGREPVSSITVGYSTDSDFPLKESPFSSRNSTDSLLYGVSGDPSIEKSKLVVHKLPECKMYALDMANKEKLGKGGQATAYLVRDADTHDTYVYKEYRKLNEFQRELDLQSKVQHENIVRLLCVNTERKGVLMKFLGGGDLWHQGTPYGASEKEISLMAAQLILSIEALHKMGFLHHDVKPQNLVRQDGNHHHVELIDFGLAVILEQANFGRGTRVTMAPEVARIQGYEKYSPLLHQGLDWWSVGATIYMLHTLSKAPVHLRKATSQFVPYRIIPGSSGSRNEVFTNQMLFAPIPSYFSPELKSLLNLLMAQNPNRRRFPPKQLQLLKQHPYFKHVNWETVGLRPQPLHTVNLNIFERDYSIEPGFYSDSIPPQESKSEEVPVTIVPYPTQTAPTKAPIFTVTVRETIVT